MSIFQAIIILVVASSCASYRMGYNSAIKILQQKLSLSMTTSDGMTSIAGKSKGEIASLLLSVPTVASMVLGMSAVVNAEEDPVEEITNKVFFDVTADGKPLGRITIGLFGKTVPKTVGTKKLL